MYEKRAFVHWYVGEGISDGCMNEGRENINHLISLYKESMILNNHHEEDE